jgi:hypothetical protein
MRVRRAVVRAAVLRAAAVLAPILAGAVLWLGWRSGRLVGGERRAGVLVSAQPGDWALAAGVGLTVVSALVLLGRRRASARPRATGSA